jgi:hypothetical protein
VERADEVLPLGQVDPDLAADRRVNLPDERRGHRDPVDASQVRRGDEADEIGRRAAADRGDGPGAVDTERAPETLGLGHRLRGLTAGNRVRRLDAVQRGHVLVPDDGRCADLTV